MTTNDDDEAAKRRAWARWEEDLRKQDAERRRKQLGLPDDDTPLPTGLSQAEEDAQNSPEYWSRYPPD